MSGDPIRCRDCGEMYDPKGSPHEDYCPGSANDIRYDLTELENAHADLQASFEKLVARIAKLERHLCPHYHAKFNTGVPLYELRKTTP